MENKDTIREMLRLIIKKRDAFTSGTRTLEVSLGALNILNKILLQDLTHPLGDEFAKMKLPSLGDLTIAKTTLATVPSLVILGGPRIEKMQPINLSLFQNLVRLRVESIKPYLIEALPRLSCHLTYVKVTNALASGDELLEFEDSPDGAWKELKTLDLSDNFMVEIHPLTGTLRNLTDLDLSNNMITEIKCIQGCYALTRLCLTGNQIEDLKGASTELGCIRILNLRKNKIHCLDGLERLLGLEELDLGENKIDSFAEVSKLGTLPILSSLHLDGNDVTQRKTYRQDVLGVFIKQFAAETATSMFRLDGLAPTEEEIRFIESSTPKIYNPIITFSSRAVAHGMDGNSTISMGAVTTPVTVVKKKKVNQKRKKKTKIVNIDSSVDSEYLEKDPIENINEQEENTVDPSATKKAEAWMEKIMDIKEKFGSKWLVGVNELMNEIDPPANESPNDTNIECDIKGESNGTEDEEDDENNDYDYNENSNLTESDESCDDDDDEQESCDDNDFDAVEEFVENKGTLDDYSHLLGGTSDTDKKEYSFCEDEEESKPSSVTSEYVNGNAVVTDYSSLFMTPSKETAKKHNTNPFIDDDDEVDYNNSSSSSIDDDTNDNESVSSDQKDNDDDGNDIKNEKENDDSQQQITNNASVTATQHINEENVLTKIQKEIDNSHKDLSTDAFNIAFKEDVDITTWLALKVFLDASETSLFAMNCISSHTKVPAIIIVSNRAVYMISSETQKPVSLKEWITKKNTIVSCPFQSLSRIIVGPWYQYVRIEDKTPKFYTFLTQSHTKTHCLVDTIAHKLEEESLTPVIIHTAKETRMNFTDNIIRSKINKRPAPATILAYAQIYHAEKKKYRTLILTPMRLVVCKEEHERWPIPKYQFKKEKETFLLELVSLTVSTDSPWTLNFFEERESWSAVFGDKEDMLIVLKAINYAFFQKTKTFITS